MDLHKELNTPLGAEDLDNKPLTFGKYKGKTPDEISDIDPDYIVWMWKNIEIKHCTRAMYNYCLQSWDDEEERDMDKFYGDQRGE